MGSTTEPAPKLSSSFVGEMLPDDFPVGLKVLVVDDDLKYLKIVEQMLKTCSYQVTTCSKTTDALKILRERKCCFDVVITEVHMPDIDGFKLVELIGKENGVPVIMMSADEKTSTVARGIMHGVCDYLIKPIRTEQLRNIWQHVIRKKWNENSDVGKMQKEAIKGENEEDSDSDGDSSSKKPRLVWSLELHQRFVGAVNQIGIEKAVPRKILDLMNVPGLTRENVASHLQKYRLYLRRSSVMDEQQAGNLKVGRNMGFEQPITDRSTLVPYQPSQSHVPVQDIHRGFDRLLSNSVKTMESSGNLGVSYPSGLLQPQLYQSALLKSYHAANVQSSFVMGFLHSPNNGHLRNLSIPLSQSRTSSFSNLLDKKFISSQSQTVMGLGQASDASSRNKGVLDGYIVPGSVSSLSAFSGRADYISHLQIKSSTMNSNVVPRFEGPNIRGPNGVLTLNRGDSSNQVVPDRKPEFVGNGATLPSRFAIEDFDPRDIQKHGKTFGKIDKEG